MIKQLILFGSALLIVGGLVIGGLVLDRPDRMDRASSGVAPISTDAGPSRFTAFVGGLLMASGGALIAVGANRWRKSGDSVGPGSVRRARA